MTQLTINKEIPPPTVEKSNWPWTESSDYNPNHMPNGSTWPKLSIVAISYNQAKFLEEAIRSVLLQGYPNLEYIVIDGGSTDGSLEVIKKYEPWIDYWVSEKDAGHANAINKGFSVATGELGGWLSSDDIYLPGAFHKIAEFWVAQGRPQSLMTGTKLKGNENLEEIIQEEQSPYTITHLLEKCLLEQPATFFPLDLFRKVGGVDERYFMALDYNLWLSMIRVGSGLIFTCSDYAITRIHPNTKSKNFHQRSIYESLQTVWHNFKVISNTWLKRYLTMLILPQRLQLRWLRKLLYIIRNILFSTLTTLFETFNLMHYQKSYSCEIFVENQENEMISN